MGEGAARAAEAPAINKRPEERRRSEASWARRADAADLVLRHRAHSAAREAGTGPEAAPLRGRPTRRRRGRRRRQPGLEPSAAATAAAAPEVWVEPELPGGNFSFFPPPSREEEEEEEGKLPLPPPAPTLVGSGSARPAEGAGASPREGRRAPGAPRGAVRTAGCRCGGGGACAPRRGGRPPRSRPGCEEAAAAAQEDVLGGGGQGVGRLRAPPGLAAGAAAAAGALRHPGAGLPAL